jgi:hypothetical protein
MHSVSPEMAVRLSKAAGSSPEMRLRIQVSYDLAQSLLAVIVNWAPSLGGGQQAKSLPAESPRNATGERPQF